jgi:hypothetical protein
MLFRAGALVLVIPSLSSTLTVHGALAVPIPAAARWSTAKGTLTALKSIGLMHLTGRCEGGVLTFA